MQIQKNTVVALRYVMKDHEGIVLDDIMNAHPVEYLHGVGDLMPALEENVDGLTAGSEKSFEVYDKIFNKPLHFDVIIDSVRLATAPEIEKRRVIRGECGPDCTC